MSPSGDMKSVDTDLVWRALADPTRRGVLDFLSAGPKTTGEIVLEFDSICRTGVMKHLGILESANLVVPRREGRVRWNHLNPVPIQRVCDRWISKYVSRMASAMSRLKDLSENQ